MLGGFQGLRPWAFEGAGLLMFTICFGKLKIWPVSNWIRVTVTDPKPSPLTRNSVYGFGVWGLKTNSSKHQ